MTEQAVDPKVLAEIVAASVRDLDPKTLLGGLSPAEIGQMAADMRAIKKAMETQTEQRNADSLNDARKVQASIREYEQVTGERFEQRKDKGAGLRAATYVRAIGAARINGCRVDEQLRAWGHVKLAEEAAEKRALNTGDAAAGGALFAGGFLNELIELQRNSVVARQIPGVRQVNMPSGSLEIKKQSGAGSAAYTSEGAPAASSQQTTGSIVLNGKKLVAVTPVSNDLLRIADASADAFVRDDLVNIMSIREDLAFLRGDGSSNTPRGLRYSMDSNMIVNTGGATAALIRKDGVEAMSRLAQRNVKFSPANACWIMSERSKYRLMNIVNALDIPAFPEVAQGMWLGYSILSTNQIPDTISTDKSEVYFVCGSEFVIGDVRGLELTAVDGAAYYNTPTSAVVSGFSQDETAIKAVSVHDCGLRHDNGCALINAVAWG